MRPPLEVEIESRWRVNVRGPGSWELCRQAGHRKPVWSRPARAWVVTEETAKDVVAMAEAGGLSVVVTGQADREAGEQVCSPAPADVEDGLW